MRKVLYIMGQLDDHDINWLIKNGRTRSVSTGDVLIEQGVKSDDMFIILDGHLSVTVDGIGTVAELGVGEIVGEMSFVDSMPPTATITAKDTGRVLCVDKQDMREELDENTGFSSRFYRALSLFLADRLRSSQARTAGNPVSEGELDENLLDAVSFAGENFNRMIQRLSGR